MRRAEMDADRRSVLLGLAAGTLLVPAAAAQADGDGSAEPVVFEIYEMLCRTPEFHAEAERYGVRTVPLITEWRFYDHEAGRLDLDRYREKIWTPGRPDQWLQCIDYTFGIPEGWDDWIDLDFEEWAPIRSPEDHPTSLVEARVREYKQLIKTTRQLRPRAKVCLHNMLRANPQRDPQTAAIELEIAKLCDATSPSMYVKEGRFGHDWDIHAGLLRRCLSVKKETGLQVYPVIWNRYRTKPFRLMPLEILREQVEKILRFEHEGQRVDGLFMFGDKEAEHAQSNLEYLRVVAETAERIAQELGPPQEVEPPSDRRGDPPHPPRLGQGSGSGARRDGLGRYD